MTESRTAAASKARHLNALRRKAPEMVIGLQELGYFVVPPEDAERVRDLLQREIEDTARKCPLCSGVNGHASICDDYGRES